MFVVALLVFLLVLSPRPPAATRALPAPMSPIVALLAVALPAADRHVRGRRRGRWQHGSRHWIGSCLDRSDCSATSGLVHHCVRHWTPPLDARPWDMYPDLNPHRRFTNGDIKSGYYAIGFRSWRRRGAPAYGRPERRAPRYDRSCSVRAQGAQERDRPVACGSLWPAQRSSDRAIGSSARRGRKTEPGPRMIRPQSRARCNRCADSRSARHLADARLLTQSPEEGQEGPPPPQ